MLVAAPATVDRSWMLHESDEMVAKCLKLLVRPRGIEPLFAP
jgi:hypothetical protein